jgi:signal transduction histidine kinase
VLDGAIDLAAETGDEEHLDRARNAVDRMQRLVDDLLTLADEGRTLGDRASVAVADLVDDCWSNVETADADLVVETDLTVSADAGRLAQLFENLFDNAVRHGGDDVTVTVADLDDATGFAVEDDGDGIPPGDREDVFESGHTTETRGTGLGLSIAEQIVEAHGWEIDVAEGGDGGARFEVRDVDVT